MKSIQGKAALFALLFVARPANAQRVESGLDAAAMSLRYGDTTSSRAASITPHVQAEWESGLAEATGTYSEFGSSGRSIEAIFSGSGFIAAKGRAFVEIGGLAGGSAHSAGGKTGELLTDARFHVPLAGAESFVGLGGGRTWDGFESRNLLIAELGASLASGPISGSVTVTPSLLGDSTRYMDAQATASWTHAGVQLSFVGGVRIGDQLSELALGTDRHTWAIAGASVPISQTLSIVAGTGTYPINPTQGFPGGRFVSVGLRLSNPWRGLRQRSAAMKSAADAEGTPGAIDSAPEKVSSNVPDLAVSRSTPDSITLRISAPGAERVEITGDFTNWDPIALTRNADGSWGGSFGLGRGEYQMNVRVNGGRWTVPRSLMSMVDEFGGTVGLLIVE